MDAGLKASADLLRELVEIESPTGHRPGVRAVAERVGAELHSRGAAVGFEGDHLVAELDGAGAPLLVLEPPTARGALKTARKGLRRFRLVVEGRAAHAGTNPEHGASAIGRAIGLDLRQATSGGGSDGNLVGALGVPVLDGLGAEGGGAHARGEHVRLASIPVRTRLLARLLEDPGL